MNPTPDFLELDVAKLAAIGLLRPRLDLRPADRQLFVRAAIDLLAGSHMIAAASLLHVMEVVRAAYGPNHWPRCFVKSGRSKNPPVEVLDLTLLIMWGAHSINARLEADQVLTDKRERVANALSELIRGAVFRWCDLWELEQVGGLADKVHKVGPWITALNDAIAALGPSDFPFMFRVSTDDDIRSSDELGPNVVTFPRSRDPRA